MCNSLVDYIVYLLNRKEFTQREDYARFKNFCDTEQLCGAARNCFDYVSDIGENWQTPAETWVRQDKSGHFQGDCDDWAWFFAEMLREQGAKFIAVYNAESGHAICLCPPKLKGGVYSATTICTFGRIDHRSNDVKEVAKYWYDDWLFIRVYKPTLENGIYRLGLEKSYTRPYEQTTTKGFGQSIQKFLDKLVIIDPDVIEEFIKQMEARRGKDVQR
jgi:hypothetical protein